MLIVVVPIEAPGKMPRANDINQHLFCWNPRTLCNLLARAGLVHDTIRYEAYGARRKLLPVYRRFGGKSYARLVRFVGRVLRFRELVVEAKAE